jgi:membrane protein implicated in regulation of membrane protease activity
MSLDTGRGGKLIGQAAMVAVAAGLTVLAIAGPHSLPFHLFVIVVLVAGISWSLFLRGPFRIVMPAVATVAFAAMAVPFVRTMKEIQRRAEPNYYALPTEEEGRRVLPVRSVPGVPGMQVRLVSAVNNTAPSWSDIREQESVKGNGEQGGHTGGRSGEGSRRNYTLTADVFVRGTSRPT